MKNHQIIIIQILFIFSINNSRAQISPMPLISLNVPAYSSSEYQDGNSMASQANKFIDAQWRSDGQIAWLAYDLSDVPESERSQILVAWYNSDYDASIIEGYTYGAPGPYVIEGNKENGGILPVSGWDILYQSTDTNDYCSYHHVINNFAGYKWLRFRTIANNYRNALWEGESDINIKMDIYNISGGITDSWIFCGNSITNMTWGNNEFGVGVHEKNANFYPAAIGAGIGFMTSNDGAERLLPKWIPNFPGKYVILSYGTNDGESATEFYEYYETMVNLILNEGKIPVIGTIIWSQDADRNSRYETYNSKLAELKAAFPKIINGPDLYNIFKNHSEWYQDDLHPNETGRDTLRKIWINWALNTVYSESAGINAPNTDGFSKSVSIHNYPNPFCSSTTIAYTIPSTGSYSLKIIDLNGREINSLLSGKITAGKHTIEWNGSNSKGDEICSGIYLFQLKPENGSIETKKLMLVR